MCSKRKQAMLTLIGLGMLITYNLGCGDLGFSPELAQHEFDSADVALTACQKSCQPIEEVSEQTNSSCVRTYTTCRTQGSPANTCSDSLHSCVATAVEVQQEGSQKYVACVDSCSEHETESEMAQSEYALSKGHNKCHAWHCSSVNQQCFRPCLQQAHQCKRDCWQARKTCMQEVRDQWRQWKEEIQVKIAFCEEMFPGDQPAIQACIEGVLAGLNPPKKNFRRCWLEGFQCAFGCWDALFDCTSDC